MATLVSYDLGQLAQTPGGVYTLGDGVVPQIARAFSLPISNEPTDAELKALIKGIAPHPELQKNIAFGMETLGRDAIAIAAAWMNQAQILRPLNGSFWSPGTTLIPEFVDAIVWCGGVANWMMRRLWVTLRQDPATVGRVVLAFGQRLMEPDEHQLVRSYIANHDGEQPTEHAFAMAYIVPMLMAAGFAIQIIEVQSTKGSDVNDGVFLEFSELCDGRILVVGNAPATIQAAGQLRAAARRQRADFDENGDQLFVTSDFFPLALEGEHKDTHQDPISGLGAILRAEQELNRAITA